MLLSSIHFFWLLILIFIIFSLFVYLSYCHDLSLAQNKINNIPSKSFKTKYGEIEYFLTGSGPTVLISHGITGGIDQGLGLSKVYLGDKYRFLYISRFGYLKSSMPSNPTPQLQAEVYKELLDYLGIAQTFIFGNSAGGPSAMNFALDYPGYCQGLILLSSAVPGANSTSPPDFVFKSDFIYWLVTKIAAHSLMSIFIPAVIMNKLTPLEKVKIHTDIFAASLPISHRSSGIIFDNHISNPSVDTIPFESIHVPTLVVHAVDDPAPPISGARNISKRIKSSKLVTYNGGHLILHHEKEIKKTIRDFIKRRH